MQIVCRIMKKEDVPMVHEIECISFSQPWTKDDLERVCEDDKALYVVAYDQDAQCVAGYMGLYQVFDEGDINQVAVAPDYRRCHIASQILTKVFEIGKERGICMYTLEVRSSNMPAIRLYEKQGFVSEGVRKGFYQFPTEDALIMWKR